MHDLLCMEHYNTRLKGISDNMRSLALQRLRDLVNGKTSQMFCNIDYYLASDIEALQSFMMAGALESGVDLEEQLNSEQRVYLALSALLNRTVCVGADMTKEGNPAALYTASTETLVGLHKMGVLVDGTDVNKVVTALTTKAKKGFEDLTHAVVRLDFEMYSEANIKIKLTIPRSRLAIGGGKDFVFIPYATYYAVYQQLQMLLSRDAYAGLHVVSTHKGKVINTYITFLESAVGKVYGDLASVRLGAVKPSLGLNPATLRVVGYNLTGSAHDVSSLEVGFRIEEVDQLNPLNIEKIDRSLHDVNPHHLRAIFASGVRKASGAVLNSNREIARYLNIADIGTVGAFKSALNLWASTASTKDLYYAMSMYPGIFGDVKEKLATRKTYERRLMKDLSPQEVLTDAGAYEYYKAHLHSGLCHFILRRKNGSLYDVYCSNNEEILTKYLGQDYATIYEGELGRLKHVLSNLSDDATSREINKSLVSANLTHVVSDSDMRSKAALKECYYGLFTERRPKEGQLTMRNVYAISDEDFFKSAPYANIVAFEYSAYKE